MTGNSNDFTSGYDIVIIKYAPSSIGIQNISGEVPTGFSLSQNYPNPFNPTTNLEFGISKSGFVTFKIYDIIGKEIETLVNDKLSPGKYKTEWNASNYSSGVYFYKLQSDGFVETKKMLLSK